MAGNQFDIEDIKNPINLVNRELGLLEFQKRVLDEAKDEGNPLLARVRFLSILGSNLDEFFMVRVGGLYVQNMEGVQTLSADGLTPAEQLAKIRGSALKLMLDGRAYFNEVLLPLLEEKGIHLLSYKELSKKQKDALTEYFHDVVFPVLTPLAFDPGHPFPHISNLSVNLAVMLEDKKGDQHFARVKVPDSLGYLVPLKRSSGSVKKDGTVPFHHYFVWLHELIHENLGELFSGMEIIEAHPFHITRNADFEIQEIESDDLLYTIEGEIRKRRFGPVVRLIVLDTMPKKVLNILKENLEVEKRDIYPLEYAPINLSSLSQLASIDRYELQFPSYQPRIPNFLNLPDKVEEPTIYKAIRDGEFLLHHPYDSFMPIVDFLNTAARDPKVVTIKATLYRVGKNSPVVDALLRARRDYRKQVAVLVELKARFDEESNIEWARMLEQEGVHVTYGLLGLKTHCKLLMVVRNEGDVMRRYLHLGTGNYNHITAQLYEDIGMFTCDEVIAEDVSDLFNVITGYSNKTEYQKLLVAPNKLRHAMEEKIQREIDQQEKSKRGYLIFKINALVDPRIIQLLYKASQAGVKVVLIVRGTCSLRPGIKGLSDNIRVISVLGRYLEHSRIYYFHNGGDEEIWMGSADLMQRNLDRRIETLFPIEDRAMIKYVRNQILRVYFRDNYKARMMLPDGTFYRVKPKKGDEPFNVQEYFMYHRKVQDRDLGDELEEIVNPE